MELTLYKALRSAKIGSDDATAVVQAMDDEMANKVQQATQPLLTKIEAEAKATERQFAATNSRITLLTWMIGLLIALIIASGAVSFFTS